MKRISTILSLLSTVALLAMPGATRAQTLTLNSVSATQFCAGDPVSVTFTATGTWGHKNAFTLELSDTSGSFSISFSNIGSVADTAPGTFTSASTIPSSASASTHYRIRVIGAYPYIASNDNGSDLTINALPPTLGINFPFAMSGTPLEIKLATGFLDSIEMADSVFWNFGIDAAPATVAGTLGTASNETIIYATGGMKTIEVRIQNSAGCFVTSTKSANVLDCDPTIPKDAIVIASSQEIGFGSSTIWVNPGVTVTLGGGSNTIFAETGATVVNGGGGSELIYLKPGAAYMGGGGGGNTIIYAAGASVQGGGGIECPSLQFDYTDAPPNAVMAAFEGVAPAASLEIIELYPNPTNGIVTLQNLPMGANVMVMNVLGETVQTETERGDANLTLDLSGVAAGTYYIRIASTQGVVTKKLVKE